MNNKWDKLLWYYAEMELNKVGWYLFVWYNFEGSDKIASECQK